MPLLPLIITCAGQRLMISFHFCRVNISFMPDDSSWKIEQSPAIMRLEMLSTRLSLGNMDTALLSIKECRDVRHGRNH